MARSSFLRAFLASVVGTGLSRVLGAGRDVAIAAFLGAGATSDAFWIAFTIPNTFRRFVADEGLTGAMLPGLAKAESEEGEPAARRLADTTLSALLLVNLALCVVGVIAAPVVVLAFAWSFRKDPELFALTVELTRWLFPFVALVSFVSFAEGLLNHRHHYFLPKVAPGLISLGVILAVLLPSGWFARPVDAVVAGTMIGGSAHVLLLVPALRSRWGALRLRFAFDDPRFRALSVELSKVVAIGIFAQINILVLRQLAASMERGAVTWYGNANRLVDLTQGIIAVGVGSALLPAVSAAVAQADWDRFRRDLVGAIRLAAFVLLPAGVVCTAFAEPVTASVYRLGQYSWSDVQQTANTLAMMVPFMLAVAGINIVKKVFFALEDRNSLLAVGATGVALTGLLGAALVEPLGVSGLALALSGSTLLQLAIYLALLHRRLGDRMGLGLMAGPLLRMSLATAPMGAFLWWAQRYGAWELGPTHLPNLALLVGALATASLLYVFAAWALGIEELRRIQAKLSARFRRPPAGS